MLEGKCCRHARGHLGRRPLKIVPSMAQAQNNNTARLYDQGHRCTRKQMLCLLAPMRCIAISWIEFVAFIKTAKSQSRSCKVCTQKGVLAAFRIQCSKRKQPWPGILQRRFTGAIKRPHSEDRLDHMTGSQTTTSRRGLRAAV